MSRPSSKLQFLPWFPARFLSSTRGWSITAKGVYRELYDCQWEMLGLPADPAALQVLIGATKAEWRASWSIVEPEFPIDIDGLRRNPLLEADRGRSLAIRDRNRLGAEKTNAKRWGARLIAFPSGGNRNEQ